MRETYLRKTAFDQLTQGSIINNCIAEGVSGVPVWGLIVTPRCDLAHDGKVPTVHYLPIIHFEDWLRIFAKKDIYDNWKNNKLSSINQKLQSKGLGSDLLSLKLSRDDIKKILEAKFRKKDAEGLFEVITRITDDELCLFKEDINGDVFKKDLLKMMKSLIKEDIHSYYFIESWNAKDVNKYKVILLRDIRRIEFSLAQRFSKGFYEAEITQDYLRMNDLWTSQSIDNIYYIDAQLQSPYIEHLMQSFSYNFTRIGLDDFNEDMLIGELYTILKKIITQ